MASLLPTTKLMFLGNDGNPLVGGKVYTYDSGTNTPRATYSDAAGTTPLPNPIILDSRGEALVFWTGSYRVRLADALDNTIWTADSISEIILSYRTSSNGSAIIPYGTTAQRDAVPQLGYFRYNTDTSSWEGYGAAGWGSIGGGGSGSGATGGGTDLLFSENETVMTTNYTIGDNNWKVGVTISILSPAVFQFIGHGFVEGQQVRLKTTGALPTGVTAGAVYYVIATGLTADSFQLATALGGTGINATGTQSGVHSVNKVKNAMMTGPLSINSGVVLTIPSGSRLVVL